MAARQTFDIAILTAANAAQARGYEAQLAQRRAEGALSAAMETLVIPDPGGRRVGSLGATLNAFRVLARKANGADPFANRRILICHSGGDARRTPAYAALGKIFTPLPDPSAPYGTPPPALFDLILRNAEKLPSRRGGQVVVLSGDVLVSPDERLVDFSKPGVTGVAWLDTPERGSRHGVYVPETRSLGLNAVRAFLQKPSADEARRAGALVRGREAVDTGILSIDAATARKMLALDVKTGDLYVDFAQMLVGGFAPFHVNVLAKCGFLHMGSTRELLANLAPRTSVFTDGVSDGAKLSFAGDNIATFIPSSYRGRRELAKGECLTGLPVGERDWAFLHYRIEDNFKTDGKWEAKLVRLGGKRLALKDVVPMVNHARLIELRRPQSVEVTAPIRIDFAGGWSDTPPICFDRGGTVVNAGMSMDGRLPIKVVVRRWEGPGVRIRSLDLGKRGVLKNDAEVRDHSDPHDWRALVKSALSVTGYKFSDGPLDITLSADLPKGSGLGTSSILGACTVTALERIAGRDIDVQRAMELTLALEQEMHTGGGWEDQMGALVPGVKILRTKSGRDQRPTWEFLEKDAAFARYLKTHGLLYFTGEKRMARNILRGVLARFAADKTDGRRRVAALKAGAERQFDALKAGDFKAFAREVAEYWRLKKQMDPGSTNIRVESVVARISEWTDAVTLCGAGGGGFMFILAKSPADARKIRAELTRHPVVRAAYFADFALESEGVKVAAS